MELTELAITMERMAYAHLGDRTWILPAGIPEGAVSWDNGRQTLDGTRWAAVRMPVVRYTDNGYAMSGCLHVGVNVGDQGIIDVEDVDVKIASRFAGTIARHEKLGHPPARYDELDPDIAHLGLDPIYGAHLDRKYGSDAPRIARRLVGRVLRRERAELKKGLPKGSETIDEKATVSSLVISGNVELGHGVTWKSGVLVIENMLIAETMASALRGGPISLVVKHEMLGDHAIVDIMSAPRTSEEGGGTTTMRIDLPAIPVRKAWPFTD